MSDTEMSGLITAISKAMAGDILVRKTDLYTAMKRIARASARDGETAEKAFVRLFTMRHSPGLPAIKAYQAAGTATHIRKGTLETAMPDVSDGEDHDDDDDGSPTFSDLVDTHQAANPGMKRSQSVDHVMTTREGRACMSIEKRRVLGKAGPMNSGSDGGGGYNRQNAVPAASRGLMHNGGVSRTVATRGAATRSMPSGNETYDDTDDTSLADMVDGCVATTGMPRGRATAAVLRSKKGAAAYSREKTQRLRL